MVAVGSARPSGVGCSCEPRREDPVRGILRRTQIMVDVPCESGIKASEPFDRIQSTSMGRLATCVKELEEIDGAELLKATG